MLEILYRIYEVADEETAKKNRENDMNFGIFSSTSKAENTELVMDCKVCDSRDQFKEIIRAEYGEKIAFAYRKDKMKAGDLYCIVIGEHCYDTERYFQKHTFTCAQCGHTITTYLKNKIEFGNYEIKHRFFGIEEYRKKQFCSEGCKWKYEQEELARIRPDDDKEFYVTRDMFTEQVAGYIYLITKKTTGEFYVGQTIYAPVFRWAQHLKTERFNIKGILDYQFEVIKIVPKGENILEREKYWIQKKYKENPAKSLNIMQTAGLAEDTQ